MRLVLRQIRGGKIEHKEIYLCEIWEIFDHQRDESLSWQSQIKEVATNYILNSTYLNYRSLTPEEIVAAASVYEKMIVSENIGHYLKTQTEPFYWEHFVSPKEIIITPIHMDGVYEAYCDLRDDHDSVWLTISKAVSHYVRYLMEKNTEVSHAG